jgi:hypothetical protein
MTSLLGYFVERSVRSRSEATAKGVHLPGDPVPSEKQQSEPPSDAYRGALRPRIRNRHERHPEFEVPGRDTLMPVEETREWLSPRASEEHQAEAEGPSTTDTAVHERLQQRGSEPRIESHAPGIPARRVIAEPLPARQPHPETPGVADIAATADEARSRSDRRAANALDVPHLVTTERQAAATGRVSPEAEPAYKSIQVASKATQREPERREARLESSVVRPRTEPVERPLATTVKSVAAEQGRSTPQPLQIPQVVAARPAFEQPSAPRIEVNIGRVEVRAVYAPPAPRRYAPSSPSTSLDEYLKQRDRAT